MNFTFGAELELADVDTTKVLPSGNTWDMRDYTVRNTNGTWNDPKKLFNKIGGEINTKVCNSASEATLNILDVLDAVGGTVNSSTNLHIHIGIPDWDETTVKILVEYVWRYQRDLYKITPLPDDLKLNRRKVSNQHKIPTYIYNRIMDGDIDFGDTRFGINIKSLYTHGTVEFRQFSMTKDSTELLCAFMWCEQVVRNALNYVSMAPGTIAMTFPQHHAELVKHDTSLHYGRHTRQYILDRIKQPKLAFICFGNVNRSRVAEIVFRSLDVTNRFYVESFGVRKGTYGKPIHKQTAQLLRSHGYEFVDTGSKQLPPDYEGLVIDVRDIVDPGYTKDKHYEAFILIEAKMKILYKELTDEEPKAGRR